MNKVSGKKSSFNLISEDASRTVIGYGCKKVTGKSLYEWYEIYIYKTKKGSISLQDVKEAIIADIDARTDEKILSGFVWNVPQVGGEPVSINVWLSDENQRNFSEAQRMAASDPNKVLPLRFKLGEDENGAPVYYEFTTVEELNDFYFSAFGYINQCLNDGWAEKDAIDWSEYEALYPVPEQAANVEE